MRTGPAVKAWLLALKYFKIFPKSTSFILASLVRQIPINDAEITESKEIQEMATRYPQGKSSAEERRRKDVWRTLRGVHAVQAFKNHIASCWQNILRTWISLFVETFDEHCMKL